MIASPIMRFDQIPAELRALRQWVNWRIITREGKPTKVPYCSRIGNRASTTDASTWSSFDDACEAYEDPDNAYRGIGFVFKADGGIFGFDADKMRDPDTGEIHADARAVLDRLNTYAEASQSLTGVHAIGHGVLPGPGKNPADSPYELYDRGRFFCMTGLRIENYPAALTEVNGALTDLYAALGPLHTIPDATSTMRPTHELSDDVLIEKASSASNGDAFRALWAGDTSAHDGNDSSADQSLCNRLAWWTNNNPEQMDRLFRRSGLMRDKWDSKRGRGTYGEKTIAEAIRITHEGYTQPAPPILITNGRRVDPDTGEVLEDEEESEDKLPLINVTNRRVRDIVADALKALQAVDTLYQRGGTLVRTRFDDDRGRLITDVLNQKMLRGILERCADFVRQDGKKKVLLPVPPPLDIVDDITALQLYRFRKLSGIVEAPVVRTDGTILTEPGYDVASGLLYVPDVSLTIPPIPDMPTELDILAARSLIVDNLLYDFQFATDADLANAVALLLTPFVRDPIDGPTPLMVLEAPSPGAGKGILADVLTIPAFGEMIGNLGECGDDPEWRKQITSALLTSTRIIRIDNVVQRLDSASLARALTTSTWEDRILGSSAIVQLPVRCVWMATGNNVLASTEITRRTVRIRLDPTIERPWKRTGFKYPNLVSWAREHRGALLAAALTLIRAWYAGGKQTAKHQTIGSYEAWADTLAGILATAKISGFLENMEDHDEDTDMELNLWHAFVELWWARYGIEKVRARDLLELAKEADIPLRSPFEHAQNAELGMALHKQRGRILGKFKINRQPLLDGITRWQLGLATPPEFGTSESGGCVHESGGREPF